MKNVAVFVDVSNLYYTVNHIFKGRKVDYAAYLAYAARGYSLVKAVAYGAKIGREADHFIKLLQEIGFETKYKDVKIFTNKGNRQTRKADWDVGISIDVVNFILENRVDKIVLGSADSDMGPLVEWIINQGIECHVLACNISKDLSKLATSFEEIGPSLLVQEMPPPARPNLFTETIPA